MTRVSVLITVHNGEAYLRSAMRSVQAQSYADWELLVVDDGSTDQSAAIVEELAAADTRIRLIRLEKQVMRTRALMRGLEEARGEYLAVLDADDLCLPERIARQVEELDSRPGLALVGCHARLINESGETVGELSPESGPESIRATLPYSNPLAHSGVMYRLEIARSLGGYSYDYPYAHDMRLFLSMIEAGWELDVLPETLVCIREHGDQMTVRPSLELARRNDMARTFFVASGLTDIPVDSRRKGLRAAIYCEMRCVRALWATTKTDALTRFGAAFLRHPWLTIRSIAVNPDLRGPVSKVS